MKKSLLLLSLLILLCTTVYSQGISVKKYVTDETGTLTSDELNTLETKLSGFEQETSNQVVVYMMNTLNGGSIEETSIEIAEKNGIGQKGKDNGILLLVVKDDRLLRIEVGYGLEGALTDALSNQIIRKEITPAFKQGNYFLGINKGVDAIISATKGEYTADKKFVKKDDDSPAGPTIGCCGLPVLFVVMIIFFGLFAFMNIFRRIFGGKRGMLGGRKSGGIFFPGGFGGGGSSWGGGGGFGGFSGGGGSFGGGGSSGSW